MLHAFELSVLLRVQSGCGAAVGDLIDYTKSRSETLNLFHNNVEPAVNAHVCAHRLGLNFVCVSRTTFL
jgi:hypothetical protein